MKIISTNKSRGFIIEDESKNLLVAHYMDNDFQELKTNFNDVDIVIRSIPEAVIFKNRIAQGEIRFNSEGNATIKLLDKIDNTNNKEWELLTKRTWMKIYYSLINAEKESILNIQISKQFFSQEYLYQLEIIDTKVAKNELIELIFYSCFASRHLRFES